MPVISPELQSKITIWRIKSNEGTLSIEEMREAVLHLRSDRRAAAEAPAKSRSRAPAKSADDMLAELNGL